MMSAPTLTIAAPAKLNLHLAVLDKRPDGFHNLESIFFALDFGDTLHFQPIQSIKGNKAPEIIMEGADFDLPPEKNIVFKAHALFCEKTGFDQGLKIRVQKRIPFGGGLGGGSSDAAATLLALNKLSDYPLSRGELLESAAALGSDVPFFIYQTPAAWVSGRGEYIEPLKAPPWFFVLVNPGFPSDTAAAFKLLDESRSVNHTTYRSKDGGSLEEVDFQQLHNDFLPVFPEPEKSVYNGIIFKLRELGADFANLSGAGSTCFGVFKNKESAEKAAASLRADGSRKFVECCKCALPSL